MSIMPKKIMGDKLLIGRHEWCQLPELNIPSIKAKIDTGAKTSAIHAFNIKSTLKKGRKYVSFDVHPMQGNDKLLVSCKALVIDERYITSSNGHKEHRYVISTPLKIADQCWDIEVTLSNRDPLRYRMLLGREAMNHRVLVHPGMTCNQGEVKKTALLKMYRLHKK